MGLVLYLLCISESVKTRLLNRFEDMLVMTGHDNTLESDVRSGDISKEPGASLEDLICLWSTKSPDHEDNSCVFLSAALLTKRCTIMTDNGHGAAAKASKHGCLGQSAKLFS